MATIDKKLIHFEKLSDFESRLAAGDIQNRSIVWVKDAKLIWTHGTYYRDFYCPQLSEIPTEDTLTYTEADGVVRLFSVGQEAIVGDNVYKFMGLTSEGKAKWKNATPVTFAGDYQTAKAPYASNTFAVMSTGIYLSNEETEEAPVSLYTDNDGNRLLYDDDGYVISDDTTTSTWTKVY